MTREFSWRCVLDPPLRSAVLAALIALLPASGTRAQPPPRRELASKLESCRVPGLDEQVLCGRLEVPERRGGPGGRTISLNIVVLPATTDSVASDPLVFLAGGGVVPATRYARFLARAFSTLRRHRDVLLVDQRGTWNSNPLSCGDTDPAAESSQPDMERAAADARGCRDSLAAHADLSAYTTDAAMEDLDAVRDWLGYPRLNLYGVSYGTRAAQVYLRRHPDRVRVAVLYGVVPLSTQMQVDLAGSAQKSLEQVFSRCSSDDSCRKAFPNLAAEFDSVVARLVRRAVQVAPDPGTGVSRPVEITDRAFRDLVQSMLGSSRAIERLPLLIHRAYGGDHAPIGAAIAGDGPPPPPGPPLGVFLCLLCSEGLPLQSAESDLDRAARGSFFGSGPVRMQMRQCAEWPKAPLPASFWEPVRSQVPVLVLSGDLDPITPPSYGEAVARGLGNARHIVMPNRSHQDVDPCITSMFERFIVAGGAAGLDTSCVATTPRLRFETSPGARSGR